MAGWIADHRKEIESDVWLMPPMYHRVWQWLKYKVNHAPAKIPNKDGTFTTILPGQHATSYRLIAKGVGYYEGLKWKEPNVKTIKSILDWMVRNQMITLQGNTLGTIVTVAKWEEYQKINDKGNAKETRSKHDLDTNNNDEPCLNNDSKDIGEKEKPKRKRFTPPTVEEVKNYCVERQNNVDPEKFVDYYEANGWMRGKTKIKDWKACVRTWEKNEFSKPGNGGDKKPPHKKTAFHLGESRFKDYTNDDLERMLQGRKKKGVKNGISESGYKENET